MTGVSAILFISILLMYLISLVGNLLITSLVCLASTLHTPMYFFLCNLSLQDMFYISSILPKLMVITVTGDTSISFPGCILQMFMFVFCLDAEFFLLTAMAYDRYVAICKPLHYSVIMNNRLCFLLNVLCWIAGGLNGLMHSLMVSRLSFCMLQDINHIFCELKIILAISCSDTSKMITIILIEGLFIGVIPFVLIMTSYVFIISSILKIRTSAGRLKTFSSCSSHLVIVILLYGTSLGFYMKTDSEHSQEQDKLLSLLYIAVVPMLNPLVYSLRNKEVLNALKTFLKIPK
ncbi:PREDICTED: olfactory receptor 5V1-like [Nanorana parkeri]|uniref:olfactory receptor 5V1-like n=1 Tax=Nanorana parkeri TaxID=125878 RepID=UPI000854C778|nr:PREDICTED: olfactory receptor 5V1-like [Nanorana parkeri]